MSRTLKWFVIKQKRYFSITVLASIFVFGLLSFMNKNVDLCTVADTSFVSRLRGPLKVDDQALVDYVKNIWLSPPSILEYNFTKDSKDIVMKNALSWEFIHKNIQRFFNATSNGFFVEAGALDGDVLSNTVWLEVHKNWTGLLVEPDPVNYKVMMKKHRKAWTSNTCLSTVQYPTESVLVQLSNQASPLPMKKLHQGLSYEIERGFNYFEGKGKFEKSFMKVQCVPLETLLLALKVTVVDFLSLDIQGGEWEILKLFPFHKIKLRALVVEHYTAKLKEIDSKFIQYMNGKGFVLVGTSYEPDYFFVLKDDPEWSNLI